MQTASRCTPSPSQSTCSPKPIFNNNEEFILKKKTNLNQIKSLENVFNHHLSQYLVNNAYLNNSPANFQLAMDRQMDKTGNLDCLNNLNNLNSFRNDLTSSDMMINTADYNSKHLNDELNKNLEINQMINEDMNEEEDDTVSIDVDGGDDDTCKQQTRFEDNVQKNLIKSLTINSDTNSIKSELKSDLKSEFKSSNFINKISQDKKLSNNQTISSLSSSSSSSTDTQYNINSFLYPHWLLSCTQ